MWEMIFVVLSVVGCFAGWYNLNQNKDNIVIIAVYNNSKLQEAGIATTLAVAVVAAYFGWAVYAGFCLVSIPLDFAVKRAIFAR